MQSDIADSQVFVGLTHGYVVAGLGEIAVIGRFRARIAANTFDDTATSVIWMSRTGRDDHLRSRLDRGSESFTLRNSSELRRLRS